MKIIKNLAGFVFSLALIAVLLITSVEAVAYWNPGYYEKEYAKYGVTEDVRMEMDDLLAVTGEMMSYLRGNREDLHVQTVVDGQEREFFNEREIAHMEDVRGLFLGALAIRRVCLGLMLLCLILLAALKTDFKRLLPKCICVGTGVFLLAAAALAAVISTDFNKYFVMFHHIFFDNDLWILDPATDLLINIVPEPFFMDTAARIGLVFGILIAVIFLSSLYLTRKNRPKM